MDRHSVDSSTYISRHHLAAIVKSALAADQDNDRVKRLQLSLCRSCHYFGNGIGGAAMTTRPCGICQTPVTYGSTCTDALCLNCAKKHSLCKHCGADRELRPHRRKFDWIKPTVLETTVESNRQKAIAARIMELPPTDSSGETVRMVMMPSMILLPKRTSCE